jgi:hypothetical protein
MSPTTRDVKQHTKVRQRRRLTAQERLDRDRAQAQQAAQALGDMGFPTELVTELEGRLRSQQPLVGNISGVTCPPLYGCRPNAARCRVRGWSCCGATLPASVRPRAAAGSGHGWAMTRDATRMASRGVSWAPGGVARKSGGSPGLLACAWSWSSARARWSSPAMVRSVGQTPRALEGRVGTHGAGWSACGMGA